MSEPQGDDDMTRSNVMKLPDTGISSVLASATAAIDRAGEDIAAGVAETASSERYEPQQNGYAYSGHTDGSMSIIAMQTSLLEAEIDNINAEIRMTADEAAHVVNVIEAARDDRLERLIAKRENALRSAGALVAMKKALGSGQ